MTFLGWLSDPFEMVKWPSTRGWKGHELNHLADRLSRPWQHGNRFGLDILEWRKCHLPEDGRSKHKTSETEPWTVCWVPWMSRWKLGSMVRISGWFHPKEYPIYKQVITHLLTIGPNFLGHPSGGYKHILMFTSNFFGEWFPIWWYHIFQIGGSTAN